MLFGYLHKLALPTGFFEIKSPIKLETELAKISRQMFQFNSMVSTTHRVFTLLIIILTHWKYGSSMLSAPLPMTIGKLKTFAFSTAVKQDRPSEITSDLGLK